MKLTGDSFIKGVSKSHKVPPKTHHFQLKIKKKFWKGAQPIPRPLPDSPVGRGHPLPTSHPFSFWGTSSLRSPPELCPWTTLGDFRSPSSAIAAFSNESRAKGNESLCFSLRLCFISNDVCSAPNSWRTRNHRSRGWMTMTKLLVLICLYCLKCTKFVQVILMKIINIVATRCQILRL